MLCKNCNKEILKNKFCSSSCSASYNNRNRKKEVFCLNCRKPLGTRRSKRKFCSNQCQSDYLWKIRKSDIESGAVKLTNATSKRYLSEKQKKSCAICGLNDWRGHDILLILDHIDGDYSNWDISNLRLICSNCDAQTETYKGRNRGRGRFLRAQRYRDKKSY